MKVLLINGSPRKNGNTSLALAEMEKIPKFATSFFENYILTFFYISLF